MTQPGRIRFQFIDALRGVAATLVVVYHFFVSEPLHGRLEAFVPPAVAWVFANGWVGVAIFFVISGFVISYSLRDAHITPGYVGRFALRRSLRLDPPYWLVLILFILIRWIAATWLHHPIGEIPNVRRVIANFLYLQNITGQGDIVTVAWTLCLEIQFYLVLVILLGVSSPSRGTPSERLGETTAKAILFIPLFLVSAFIAATQLQTGGWFIGYWYLFFLGALTSWVGVGRMPLMYWTAATLIVLAAGIYSRDLYPLVGAGTAGVILVAAKRNSLRVWLSHSVFQYLGRISYSLYLLHTITGGFFVALAYKRIGGESWAASTLFILGVLVSIVTADVFYRLVEAPSVRLARKIQLDQRKAS